MTISDFRARECGGPALRNWNGKTVVRVGDGVPMRWLVCRPNSSQRKMDDSSRPIAGCYSATDLVAFSGHFFQKLGPGGSR
jgi:hypothetical protein